MRAARSRGSGECLGLSIAESGRLGGAVTPAAKAPAWACFRQAGQLKLECCAQSQLVGALVEHREEGAGLVGADYQVGAATVDCEPGPR